MTEAAVKELPGADDSTPLSARDPANPFAIKTAGRTLGAAKIAYLLLPRARRIAGAEIIRQCRVVRAREFLDRAAWFMAEFSSAPAAKIPITSSLCAHRFARRIVDPLPTGSAAKTGASRRTLVPRHSLRRRPLSLLRRRKRTGRYKHASIKLSALVFLTNHTDRFGAGELETATRPLRRHTLGVNRPAACGRDNVRASKFRNPPLSIFLRFGCPMSGSSRPLTKRRSTCKPVLHGGARPCIAAFLGKPVLSPSALERRSSSGLAVLLPGGLVPGEFTSRRTIYTNRE